MEGGEMGLACGRGGGGQIVQRGYALGAGRCRCAGAEGYQQGGPNNSVSLRLAASWQCLPAPELQTEVQYVLVWSHSAHDHQKLVQHIRAGKSSQTHLTETPH